MRCPGSVALSKHVGPAPSSIFADEGTAAHELGELCLALDVDAEYMLGTTIPGKNRSFVVDEGMAAAVQVHLDHVREKLEKCARVIGKPPIWHIEYRVDLTWLRPGMFGTADIVIVGGDELLIIDYKHGQGVAVEAKDNTQMRYYAVGPAHDFPQIQNISMTIVQPRAPHSDGPIRTDRISRRALLEWANETLGPAVDRTREPKAPREAGDHCRWCAGLHICPEALEKAQNDAALDFTAIGPKHLPVDFVPTDMETLSKILASKDFINNYLEAVAKEARRRLDDGTGFPGWKLIRGRSNRKWKDEDQARRFLRNRLGIAPADYLTPTKLRTPNQMEKVVKAQFEKAKRKEAISLLSEYWEMPPGQPRMVTTETKGEPINPNAAPDVPAGEFETVEEDIDDIFK